MEERVLPASTSEDSAEDPPAAVVVRPPPPPPQQQQNSPRGHEDDSNSTNQLALSVRPGQDQNTYVVHFPKDQIYRVPPPQNAAFVERHRSPSLKKKKKCSPRLACCLGTLVVLGLLITAIALTCKFVFEPKAPSFSVVGIHVTKTDGKMKSSHPPKYDVVVEAHNQNSKMGMKYGNGDGAKLLFKEHELARGEFPDISQDGYKTSEAHLNLTGSKGKLPKQVDKSMHDEKSRDHSIWLTLKLIKIPVKYKVWGLKISSKVMDVTCNFRASSLREGEKILSTNCDSDIS